MNPLVFVDNCDVGLGLFSTREIKKGETILVFSGEIISGEEGKISAFPIQISLHNYFDPEPPGRFINHSCQPNAGIIKNNILIALQDIPHKTEVRFDYSTTMWERFWTMECACGATQCRKIIQDFDLLPLELQKSYLEKGIVQDFIIQQLKSSATIKLPSHTQSHQVSNF